MYLLDLKSEAALQTLLNRSNAYKQAFILTWLIVDHKKAASGRRAKATRSFNGLKRSCSVGGQHEGGVNPGTCWDSFAGMTVLLLHINNSLPSPACLAEDSWGRSWRKWVQRFFTYRLYKQQETPSSWIHYNRVIGDTATLHIDREREREAFSCISFASVGKWPIHFWWRPPHCNIYRFTCVKVRSQSKEREATLRCRLVLPHPNELSRAEGVTFKHCIWKPPEEVCYNIQQQQQEIYVRSIKNTSFFFF